jgi:hypothetical protein
MIRFVGSNGPVDSLKRAVCYNEAAILCIRDSEFHAEHERLNRILSPQEKSILRDIPSRSLRVQTLVRLGLIRLAFGSLMAISPENVEYDERQPRLKNTRYHFNSAMDGKYFYLTIANSPVATSVGCLSRNMVITKASALPLSKKDIRHRQAFFKTLGMHSLEDLAGHHELHIHKQAFDNARGSAIVPVAQMHTPSQANDIYLHYTVGLNGRVSATASLRPVVKINVLDVLPID